MLKKFHLLDLLDETDYEILYTKNGNNLIFYFIRDEKSFYSFQYNTEGYKIIFRPTNRTLKIKNNLESEELDE